jgi:hypothetical protein
MFPEPTCRSATAAQEAICPTCLRVIDAGAPCTSGAGHLAGPFCTQRCWEKERDELAAAEERLGVRATG